jgi:hypothetical protein
VDVREPGTDLNAFYSLPVQNPIAIEEPLMRDGNVFTVEEPIGGVAFF